MKAIASIALTFLLATSGATLAAGGLPSDSQLLAAVRTIIAEQLGKWPAEIDSTRSLYKLGADEMDVVQIVLALEQKYQIKLPDAAVGASQKPMGRSLNARRLADAVMAQLKTLAAPQH